ncbi:hypothetical protein EP47_05000 [Legionella norrlandica]|uniref:Flagellar assembly protein FliH n=1 Tax=Legionella norrlandica TaxID=1498499 RepID=A0A0A2SSJ3_9GAMM|nr:FliH/SctL family protein [Legionella norrlandica]KGP63722.1 hypothetical protein EP47_05000 [Legionella norrlandica]
MKEHLDNHVIHEDYEIWNFPEITDENRKENILIEEELKKNTDIPDSSEQSSLVSNQEAELLRHNLNHLIDLFTELNQQLNKKIQEVDNTLVEKIALLVKKTVKKIIDKEFQQDPKLIAQIIKKNLGKISEENRCTVIVSPQDFELWQKHVLNEDQFKVEIDPQMYPGDFKLITPINELVVNMDNIINTIFKIDHEPNRIS